MNIIPIGTKKKQLIFHGGCHGCTQQQLNGLEYCHGCQYFDADWRLPSLNNEYPDEAEIYRARITAEKEHWFIKLLRRIL